jgi:hypothetical protein
MRTPVIRPRSRSTIRIGGSPILRAALLSAHCAGLQPAAGAAWVSRPAPASAVMTAWQRRRDMPAAAAASAHVHAARLVRAHRHSRAAPLCEWGRRRIEPWMAIISP